MNEEARFWVLLYLANKKEKENYVYNGRNLLNGSKSYGR